MNDSSASKGRQNDRRVRPLRTALVIFLCAMSVVNLAQFRRYVLHASPDRAARTDERFEALRRVLAGVARVGYVGDSRTGDRAAERYFLTQLALAPTLVDLNTFPPLSVSNFSADSKVSIPPGLVPL